MLHWGQWLVQIALFQKNVLVLNKLILMLYMSFHYFSSYSFPVSPSVGLYNPRVDSKFKQGETGLETARLTVGL